MDLRCPFWGSKAAKVGVAFARKTSKTENTNFSKSRQKPLGPREKLLGRAGLVLQMLFPESENYFECFFLGGGGKWAISPARWDLGHEANPKNPKSMKEPRDLALRSGSGLSSPR
jgi:hypothetical protein